MYFYVAEGFASAEATKGLSGRPLETFGLHTPIIGFISLLTKLLGFP